MRRRRASLLLGAVLGLAFAPPGWAEGEAPELVDRVLAVVDEDPILASDLEKIIGLGLVAPTPEEDDEEFRRRVLDQLIDQRLRFHEVDRFGFSELPLDEVERQLSLIRESFASDRLFQQRLQEVELDEQGLRQILARQIMVLIYVEERLGARVFVDLDDIEAHYREVLVPELRARGASAPPLAEVREEIRTLLKEQRLNEEIARWTEELRLEADIEDYFDERHTSPPGS